MKSYKIVVAVMISGLIVACGDAHVTTSDDVQRQRQETILREGTNQVGPPAIKNFRELKILRDIYELRDQEGLITFTYVENAMPVIVPGHTVLGGKLTYVGESIGYGIPASTQFSNPQKVEKYGFNGDHYVWVAMPQAEPNGLFSPASAEGTWVMMLDKKAKKALPQYFEPRVVVSTFRYDLDVEVTKPPTKPAEAPDNRPTK